MNDVTPHFLPAGGTGSRSLLVLVDLSGQRTVQVTI